MELAGEILTKYLSIFDGLPPVGEGDLRFGESLVKISTIALQYYCEKKLELQHQYPMPPTVRMQQGEAGHELVTAKAAPLTREEAVETALEEREKPTCIYEFNVGWIHNGIPIIGRVDEAWFRGGNVDLVVERKFSNSLRIYNPYHIQAQLYCLSLEGMGFNTDSTVYRIMVFKRTCYECEKLVDSSCDIFNLETKNYRCEQGEAMAFNYPFEKAEIIKELDWALGYWIKEREAIPTQNKAKCRVCDYKEVCENSLMK